jgi:hypothetical protein
VIEGEGLLESTSETSSVDGGICSDMDHGRQGIERLARLLVDALLIELATWQLKNRVGCHQGRDLPTRVTTQANADVGRLEGDARLLPL